MVKWWYSCIKNHRVSFDGLGIIASSSVALKKAIKYIIKKVIKKALRENMEYDAELLPKISFLLNREIQLNDHNQKEYQCQQNNYKRLASLHFFLQNVHKMLY